MKHKLTIQYQEYPIELWFIKRKLTETELDNLLEWHTNCDYYCDFSISRINKVRSEIQLSELTLEHFVNIEKFIYWIETKFSKAGYTDLYRYYDKDNTLLYVGISASAIFRQAQHKISATWYDDFTYMTKETFKTRKEALAAELGAIKTENPKYNITHKAAQ